MALAYFVDGESAAPEDGDYYISQVMETSMWDSFVVGGWEIDHLFCINTQLVQAENTCLIRGWIVMLQQVARTL